MGWEDTVARGNAKRKCASGIPTVPTGLGGNPARLRRSACGSLRGLNKPDAQRGRRSRNRQPQYNARPWQDPDFSGQFRRKRRSKTQSTKGWLGKTLSQVAVRYKGLLSPAQALRGSTRQTRFASTRGDSAEAADEEQNFTAPEAWMESRRRRLSRGRSRRIRTRRVRLPESAGGRTRNCGS